MDNEKLNTNMISDAEAEKVVGGDYYKLEKFGREGEVKHIFKVNDIVEVWAAPGGCTVRCRIIKLGTDLVHESISSLGSAGYSRYIDTYYCEELEEHWYFHNGWKNRSDIQIPGTT